VALEDSVNLGTNAAVDLEARWGKDQSRTFLQGEVGGHGRMNTELPSPVAGSNYYTAFLGQSIYYKWFTSIARVVSLLDRGIKSIEINVNNLPTSIHAHA
jgi:hypothetical protein